MCSSIHLPYNVGNVAPIDEVLRIRDAGSRDVSGGLDRDSDVRDGKDRDRERGRDRDRDKDRAKDWEKDRGSKGDRGSQDRRLSGGRDGRDRERDRDRDRDRDRGASSSGKGAALTHHNSPPSNHRAATSSKGV